MRLIWLNPNGNEQPVFFVTEDKKKMFGDICPNMCHLETEMTQVDSEDMYTERVGEKKSKPMM